jgi:DNA-binding transcriptional MerR regulator
VSSAALAYPGKSAEAFRTISEVADELNVPQHVLRFWESRFAQIKPVKRAGGRRYYRPDDIDLLKGIRALLYNDGFTIKGVQKVLKDRGLRHVAEIGRGGVPAAPQPVVIEKVVYVEKPVAAPPVKKPRPTHLRAVPTTLDLPFFDEPVKLAPAPEPVARVVEPAPVVETVVEPVIKAPAAQMPVVEEQGMAAEDRMRLEELLDELTGLKARLQSARAA